MRRASYLSCLKMIFHWSNWYLIIRDEKANKKMELKKKVYFETVPVYVAYINKKMWDFIFRIWIRGLKILAKKPDQKNRIRISN